MELNRGPVWQCQGLLFLLGKYNLAKDSMYVTTFAWLYSIHERIYGLVLPQTPLLSPAITKHQVIPPDQPVFSLNPHLFYHYAILAFIQLWSSITPFLFTTWTRKISFFFFLFWSTLKAVPLLNVKRATLLKSHRDPRKPYEEQKKELMQSSGISIDMPVNGTFPTYSVLVNPSFL